jgi:OOP family OmpA-OmpF porin
MRRLVPVLLLLGSASLFFAAAPALAQDEAGSKDHPAVPRINAGYVIHSYNATDFDSATFPVGEDKQQTFEGRHWRIGYAIKDGSPKSSALAITRNYINAFTAKGGTVVYKDPGNSFVTLRLKTAAGELTSHIDVSNEGEMYNVEVIEKAAMAQQVELSASELANALNTKGSVAVHNILFDTGKATIKPESSAALAPIGDLLKADATLRLEIQGHTDNVGAKAANQALSLARAAAVREYLIKTFGIAADRLTATGLGDIKPVADNATEPGRAQNRRVELVKLGAKFPPPPPSRASAGQGPSEWTGKITSGMMAIGGETTGIVIVTPQDQIELQPADQAMRQRLQQLNGKTITIRGTLETRPGVEVKTRRIIKVTEVIERS